MGRFTEYGKTVKMKLIELEKTQEWLIEEVRNRTELFIDSGYIYKILTGQRNAPKVVNAINEILGIENKNETPQST